MKYDRKFAVKYLKLSPQRGCAQCVEGESSQVLLRPAEAVTMLSEPLAAQSLETALRVNGEGLLTKDPRSLA